MREIAIDEAVVGDLIFLSGGDRVPADGLIVQGKLSVDESSLNGEAKESYKEATSNIDYYDEKNKLYRGTTIYEGEAIMLTKKVGMDTL